jgi:hypothetical protein
MRPRVQRAPGLPCALSLEGRTAPSRFGANEFANLGRMMSRECGGVFVIVARMSEAICWTAADPHIASLMRATGLHSRRPGEGRDPYGEDSRFGSVVDALCNNEGQGLWVPAQGRDDDVPHAALYRAIARTNSLTPPSSPDWHAGGRSRGRQNPGRSRRCRGGWRGSG